MRKIIQFLSVILLIWFGGTEIKAQDENLVAHWTFDDSTASDSSGNGQDGAIYGAPLFVAGIMGNYAVVHN